MRNKLKNLVVLLARIAISCGMACMAPVAWAVVDQALLEQAEALMKSGQAESAYQLLEPQELVGAGDLVFDYLLATAALESGRPSKATFVYERILAVAPAYVGVRADMGRAYYALGDFGRAKIEFETVLTFQNLPLDLRGTVEQYVKAAQERAQARPTVSNAYIEWGVGRDTNIGSATELASINLPAIGVYSPAPPDGQKTADNYSTLGFGGELNHPLSDQWSVFVGADVRGRAYETYQDTAGNWSMDGRGGLSYSGGSWLVRGGLSAGQYRQNGPDYRHTAGANVDWRLALDSTSQLTVGGAIFRSLYVPAELVSQNTQTSTLSVGWLTSLGDGRTVLGVTGSGGYEEAIGGRTDGDRRFWGPRVFLQKSFNEKLGAYASAGASYSRYLGVNSLYGVYRHDAQYDLTFGLTWTVARGLSVRPQLSYIKNDSNVELYAYDKGDASVSVRLDY